MYTYEIILTQNMDSIGYSGGTITVGGITSNEMMSNISKICSKYHHIIITAVWTRRTRLWDSPAVQWIW